MNHELLSENILTAMSFQSLLHYFLNGCLFALYFPTCLCTKIRWQKGGLGKMGEEKREAQASSYRISKPWDVMDSTRNTNNFVITVG